MDTLRERGKVIKSARKTKHLTQENLEELGKISAKHISAKAIILNQFKKYKPTTSDRHLKKQA